MKKLLNKLNGSGKFDVDALREEEHLSGDEHYEDVHYRKSATLPSDPRDHAEEIKPARKSSLPKKVISPRAKAMENDDKRSSKEIQKDKDKLNESDDKVIRKSFSLKNVTLFNKSTDQLKNTESPAVRSPSLKSMFSGYGPQKDSLVDVDGSDEEMNEDAAVPHNRALGTRDDEDLYFTAPIRVPSAPARAVTSPSPKGSKSPMMSSSPAQARTASPRIINSPPGSPQFTTQSSSPRVPTFSPTPTAPPQALKPSPLVLVADDFDAHFSNMGGRARNESITDDYGAPYRREKDHVDYAEDDEVDLDNELMQDRPKGGLFSSFGANKPKKLK